MSVKVRVRFAPSPTGELHIGGARTALYNYLFAKQTGGDFIIRIEDTDRERLVEGSLSRILEGLRWLGVTWNEGPDCGGQYAPYVQSERLPRYHLAAEELVAKGAAYYCFCSAQRLDVLREVQQAQKVPTRYDRTCLKLTPELVKEKLAAHEPYTIRLKVPAGSTTFVDVIRGSVNIANAEIDDQVLLKSDGFPTYHLANVVDDHDMAITHVIRGEEWLPSTPKHVLLYQAFGWSLPAFAHLPNVLNEKRAKLSKRRDGETVWVETYRKQGYLPQALVNFLALLGWHPHDNREVFSLGELVSAFSLERVQKAGAIFSLQKLDWFNTTYLKDLSLAELEALLLPYYTALAKEYGRNVGGTSALTEVLRTRLVTLADATEHARWFFRAHVPTSLDLVVPKAGSPTKTNEALAASLVALQRAGEWSVAEIERALASLVRPGTFTRGELLWPVRVALTGERQSPDVFAVARALGREETYARLRQALKLFTA